ncbi:MAG TPA: helix-turn-helix domain-containing protein [Candidatus Desulfaltia sp.]|nr:helix-turn-helix domain-containing protein [Candidatus Desulfaltia sp.]
MYKKPRITRLRDNPDDKDLLQIWPRIVEYIGLSEYESKVYLSLINLGTVSVRKLSINCNVPRTKVYGTLKKLIDYDLVVEIPGHPKQFSPSNPGESFNTILNITKEKATDFDNIIKKLNEVHEKRKEKLGPEKKLIWFLDKEHNIKGKCNEIIRQSEEELNIITTEDGLEILFNAAHRLLDEMLESGVEIKLYSPLDPKVNPLARELSYIYQVKQVEVETPILFINSDNKRFILAKLAPRGAEKPIESAMFTEDKDLLDLVHLLLVDGKKQLLKTLQA